MIENTEEPNIIDINIEKNLEIVRKEPNHINYWKAYKTIQRLLSSAQTGPKQKKIKVAMLSSFTIEPLVMYLDIKSRLDGLSPEFYVGSFNQVTQEILDSNSDLYVFSPEVTIIAVKAESLLDSYFFANFYDLSDEEKKVCQANILNHFKELTSIITSKMDSMVLLSNFEIPVFTSLGILDNKKKIGLRLFFQEINSELAEYFRNSKQVFIVDLENAASKHGKSRCINFELYYRGSFAYSESFLPVIAEEFMGYFRALKNLTKKCIVLDLDNTLWGGVLGEEGYDGIQLGNDSGGKAYVDFQMLLLGYYNRGIILAINSKNNLEEVMNVLRNHPNMVLRENHFAAIRANWQDKAQNMIELAAELNISLENMVFVDDLPQNRELIRKSLPQISIIDLPPSCYLYPHALEEYNEFNSLELTEEDLRRGTMYQARREREQLRNTSISLETFLTSLKIKTVVRLASQFDLPRVTSLINKTNQFNLTSRRFKEIEIMDMNKNKNEFYIYTLIVSDKYGDEGLVGVAIIQKGPETWTLNSFLLSCRVMGRGVEDALLGRIVRDAKKEGITSLIGEFIPTSKNEPVRFFYKNHGFQILDETEKVSKWKINLDSYIFKMPRWIEIRDE